MITDAMIAVVAQAMMVMEAMFVPHELPLSDDLVAHYRDTARGALKALARNGFMVVEITPWSSVKDARLLMTIARAIANGGDVPRLRAVAVEVLMAMRTMPRDERVRFAAELINPDPPEPTAIMEDEADGT